MNKKAIELSVNFMVVIVISLVVFMFGINFLYKIMGGATDLANTNQEDIDNRIAAINCGATEKICLSNSHIDLDKGEFKIVTLKVINLDGIEGHTITVTDGIYVSPSNEENTWNADITVTPRSRSEIIKENTEKSFGIGIQTPKNAPKGTYVLNVEITKASGPYDKIHKIYVNVR